MTNIIESRPVCRVEHRACTTTDDCGVPMGMENISQGREHSGTPIRRFVFGNCFKHHFIQHCSFPPHRPCSSPAPTAAAAPPAPSLSPTCLGCSGCVREVRVRELFEISHSNNVTRNAAGHSRPSDPSASQGWSRLVLGVPRGSDPGLSPAGPEHWVGSLRQGRSC